jgi:hypothetical protein
MTHRGGLSLSIIIWRIEGGGIPFALGPKHFLGGPDYRSSLTYLAFQYFDFELNKDNNKITELPTILQRESQNS